MFLTRLLTSETYSSKRARSWGRRRVAPPNPEKTFPSFLELASVPEHQERVCAPSRAPSAPEHLPFLLKLNNLAGVSSFKFIILQA